MTQPLCTLATSSLTGARLASAALAGSSQPSSAIRVRTVSRRCRAAPGWRIGS
ncbi:hypothetical protein ACFQY7_49050 [Actinomadura luteofluorescens]|uniref:hypothetical protein n=1 Tax=Actinomadura luteofluorescens TaxID=46163 RepID=UPI0036294437